MICIKSIQRECLECKIVVQYVISQIDSAIGGITRVDFKEGKKFKITTPSAIYSLDRIGIRKKSKICYMG